MNILELQNELGVSFRGNYNGQEIISNVTADKITEYVSSGYVIIIGKVHPSHTHLIKIDDIVHVARS